MIESERAKFEWSVHAKLQLALKHVPEAADKPRLPELSLAEVQDDIDATRRRSLDALNEIETYGRARRMPGGFWRRLMSVAEALRLPGKLEIYERLYLSALDQVGDDLAE